jgi:hypothetical protein
MPPNTIVVSTRLFLVRRLDKRQVPGGSGARCGNQYPLHLLDLVIPSIYPLYLAFCPPSAPTFTQQLTVTFVSMSMSMTHMTAFSAPGVASPDGPCCQTLRVIRIPARMAFLRAVDGLVL